MQPVEIKKDIFWVGCVDYDHRDFHGYSRSPEGSTYNAYLIRDEKNVLMDTVYPGWAGNMLCRIARSTTSSATTWNPTTPAAWPKWWPA